MRDNVEGFEEYKPIRNLIRKYNREELLTQILQKNIWLSHQPPSDWIKGYLPWEMLLLGRWILFDWNNIKGQKRITSNELHNLINRIKRFTDRSDSFLDRWDSRGMLKFSRKSAFQQFWFQKQIYHGAISRSIRLLILPTFSEEVESKLLESYGLKRNEIFDLFLMAWASFLEKKESPLNANYYSSIYSIIGKEKVDRFFNDFSLDINNIDNFNCTYPIKNFISEIHSKSPLYNKPFFKLKNYHLWNISFLEEFLEYGLYDILKSITPDKFGNDFGPIFEKYIRSRLEDHKIDFKAEVDLKRNGFKSQIDFVLETDDHLILIEAKGIEASKRVQLYPTDETLGKEYKKNIVKALVQANSVYQNYNKRPISKKVYVLIVTYKELFLGDGEDIWDEFAGEVVRSKYNVEDFSIPAENIFFLSLDAYDNLLLVSKFNKENIAKTLDVISMFKEKTENRRLLFNHYLQDIKELDFNMKEDAKLNKTYEVYFNGVMNRYFGEKIKFRN